MLLLLASCAPPTVPCQEGLQVDGAGAVIALGSAACGEIDERGLQGTYVALGLDAEGALGCGVAFTLRSTARSETCPGCDFRFEASVEEPELVGRSCDRSTRQNPWRLFDLGWAVEEDEDGDAPLRLSQPYSYFSYLDDGRGWWWEWEFDNYSAYFQETVLYVDLDGGSFAGSDLPTEVPTPTRSAAGAPFRTALRTW